MPFATAKSAQTLTMRRPMPGFEQLSRFQLAPWEGFEPFHQLTSLEDSKICFTLLDPRWLVPGYTELLEPALTEQVGTTLFRVFCVVVPTADGPGLNLMAPVVVMSEQYQVQQVVLDLPALQQKVALLKAA